MTQDSGARPHAKKNSWTELICRMPANETHEFKMSFLQAASLISTYHRIFNHECGEHAGQKFCKCEVPN